MSARPQADRAALLNGLDGALHNVITATQTSLVRVEVGPGQGAGTIWHPDGLVLTNAHVVAGGRPRGWRRGPARGVRRDAPQVVLPDGTTASTRILAIDPERDLAALALDGPRDLPTIPLGDARRLRPGDWVIAVGHPWGVTGAATAGAVIAVGPPAEWGGRGIDLIQVGLQLRPGHSGGALVDAGGRLVGINTMISGPQVGLAIPLYVVNRFLRERLGTQDA